MIQAQNPVSWLLEHVHAPFALAERANAKREAHFGDKVALFTWKEGDEAPYQLLWDGDSPLSSATSSAVAFAVDCDSAQQRQAFLSWLSAQLEQSPAWTHVCAWSRSKSSTQRSWLIAALRIMLPATTRLHLRVDELSLRSAQLCLNFGADTLAAPLAPARKLPIAGVASPHETSILGLATLIEQAGLVPEQLPERSPIGASKETTARTTAETTAKTTAETTAGTTAETSAV